MKRAHSAVLLLSLIFLASCAQLGFERARSFDHEWAYAMAVNTGLRQASVDAQKTGAISNADLRTIMNLNDNARALLDGAEKAKSANPQDAQAKLDLALTVLEQVSQYFKRRGVEPPKIDRKQFSTKRKEK